MQSTVSTKINVIIRRGFHCMYFQSSFFNTCPHSFIAIRHTLLLCQNG